MQRATCALLACLTALSLLAVRAEAQTPTPTPSNWSIVIAIGDSLMTGTRLLTDALPTPPDATSTHLHLQGNDGQFHTGFVEPFKCESASRCGPACGSPGCTDQLSVYPYVASLDPAIIPCAGLNGCQCANSGGILYGPGQEMGMTLLSLGLPDVDVIPCAKSGTLTSEWVSGSNLLNSCDAREVIAAARGLPYCVVVDLGTNDAGSAFTAAQVGTNLTNLFAGIRSMWGTSIPIVFWEISTNAGFNTTAFPFRNTVLAQQQSIPVTSLLTRLSSASVPLGCDGVHPTTAGYRLRGQMAAQACATMAPILPTLTPTAGATPTATPIPSTRTPFSCPGGPG